MLPRKDEYMGKPSGRELVAGSQGTIQLKKPSDVTSNELTRNAQLKVCGSRQIKTFAVARMAENHSNTPTHFCVSCGLIMTKYSYGMLYIYMYTGLIQTDLIRFDAAGGYFIVWHLFRDDVDVAACLIEAISQRECGYDTIIRAQPPHIHTYICTCACVLEIVSCRYNRIRATTT